MGRRNARPALYNQRHPLVGAMSKLEDLAERVERLLLRHDELKRTNTLLAEQLAAVTHERDNLRSRLSAARGRIDALLERLPKDVGATRDGSADAAERAA
jgi:cell division protein ZapB